MSTSDITASPYYFLSAYAPALSAGQITFPNHTEAPGVDNRPNFLGEFGHALYINTTTDNEVDLSTEFAELSAQTFRLSIKQNYSEAIYDVDIGSFVYGIESFGDDVISNVYVDNAYGIRGASLPTLVQAASADFNEEDPIILTFTNRSYTQDGYSPGLVGKEYSGFFNGDSTWFQTATEIGSEVRSDFNSITPENGVSWEWFGYFKPLSGDNFTFDMNADDIALMWVGENAISGYTNENVTLSAAFGYANTETPIYLESNTYYPVRIQFGHPIEPTSVGLTVNANPENRTLNDFQYGALFNNIGTCDPIYNVFAIPGEDGCSRFRRLYYLGYV